MIQDHGETPYIIYVTQNLFGRRCGPSGSRGRAWASESRGTVPFAVAGGEVLRHVHRCELGQSPLNAKRPIDRATAAALHSELVRRAEAEWAPLDDAGSPVNAGGDTGGDSAAALDDLDRHDPGLDVAAVDELLIADEATEDERGDA